MRPPLPPLHDPARKPGSQADARIERRRRYDGMTPAQMCESMGDAELNKNARRGGVAALAEQERRAAEKSAPAGGI